MVRISFCEHLRIIAVHDWKGRKRTSGTPEPYISAENCAAKAISQPFRVRQSPKLRRLYVKRYDLTNRCRTHNKKKSLIVAPRLIRFYPFWDCSEAKLASSSSVYNCGTRVIGAPRVLARECRLMPVSAAARLAQLALLVAMTPVPPPC